MKENLSIVFEKLIKFCEKEGYKGYDPYDGLNTKIMKYIPLNRCDITRLAWIQTIKRLPINLRPIIFVKKEMNPKGIALFLSGYCNLYRINKKLDYKDKVKEMAEKLINMSSRGYSGACWGYNFPWQSKAGLMAKWQPNIVVTVFAACALMDAYECIRIKKFLKIAISSCEFVLKDIERTNHKDGYLFSYTPKKKATVYNASMLGSRLLSRAYYYNKNEKYLESAYYSMLACVQSQKKNGAWEYGVLPYQNWIDSFHTGYNLECIYDYCKYAGDEKFKNNYEKGFEYYINNFFLSDGIPKYYNNKIFPIDIHSASQLFVILSKTKMITKYNTLVNKVMEWIVENMRNKKYGYFYYQKNQYYTNKINYMRWCQAWIFYGMSCYFLNE